MRYLSIGLDKGSVIVGVDVCQRCFGWRQSEWWKSAVWQHPMTGKVHVASGYSEGRTSCGVKIHTSHVADKHIAVSVS